MTDYDLLRLRDAYHESGHLVAAISVGFVAGAASLNPDGRQFTGCMFWSAAGVDADLVRQVRDGDGLYWSWPGAVKNRVEAEVITAMAGDIAEDLFAWGGEASETKAESRSDWLDLPEPTDAELAMTAAAHDDLTGLSDAAQVERLCRVAHDDAATAWAWQWYLESVTRALLLNHAERVKWLAIVLAEEGTLSAKAVAVLAAGPP